MSEPARTLLNYQREISKVSLRPELVSGEPQWGVQAAKLYRAGWSYVVRGSLRIWCEDPEDWRCCWKSEEIAFEIVTRGGG